MNFIRSKGLMITLCLLTIALYAAGQKANIKNVYVKYIQPPLKPLPPNVKTYMFLQQNYVSNFNITDHNQKNLSLPGYALGPDENIQRLNYSLIYNLFMNYELTEKHQNLQVLMSYFPDYDHLPAKEININSENSGFLEKIRWVYDEEGDLTDLTYEVDREEGQYVMYSYELDYEGYELKGMDIAGKRKIDFEYYKDGRLKTILRKKNNVVLQYNLEYAEEGNKAAIKLVVINGEEMRPSSADYFVVWNEKMKITDYNLDIYAGSKFEYAENGDLISQTFKGMDDDVTVSWEYEYDEDGRWVMMKYDPHASFKRVIN